MRLLEVFIFNKKLFSCETKTNIKITSRGFFVVELLVAITIFLLLAAIVTPISMSFYQSGLLDTSGRDVVETLRRAQLKAMVDENESAFGVYLTAEQYTLFKGNSYDTRDPNYDEVFEFNKSVLVDGISEIVFSRLDGVPSDTGVINLSTTNKSFDITINELGMINY